ncbi:hypothetical protein pphageT12_04 [Pseudomonas phage pphageT12]|uniref:Uncharacterized protein n=1 Tax=Pseudomonas phage phiB1_1 TaxID=2755402 RepID=A0A7D7K061_9CAUD|nr:hypothetical protein phiB1_1_03 [Pseudomonas phage phiB1_1]UAW53637.1 hypothetical protein pphageB21_04 [Pseudomonas phage pphageB21]UAW53696.1 hypothetical protein pphageT21_04 [Pseudomonas phage pphageT21]UAW53755.1 hypothetical protein pphageT12_04 [Pseudomonas phage pphageT12]UAW53816.1 hypothetical protein pphageBV72_04 [Pseudomonas phage pphageBV72]
MQKTLSAIFRSIERAHYGTETQADAILAVFSSWQAQSEHPLTMQVVDELVADAYSQNGWSQRIGRPAAGDVPAPAIIKVYVSTVRAGIRLGVDVVACQSMQELRNANKAARTKLHFKSAEKAMQEAPELVGVSIQSPGTLTGALLHDLYAVRAALAEDAAAALDVQLHKILQQYIKKAPPELRLVA